MTPVREGCEAVPTTHPRCTSMFRYGSPEQDDSGDLGLAAPLEDEEIEKSAVLQSPSGRSDRLKSPSPTIRAASPRQLGTPLRSSSSVSNGFPPSAKGMTSSPSAPSMHQLLNGDDEQSLELPLRPSPQRSPSSGLSRSRTMPRMRQASGSNLEQPPSPSTSRHHLAPAPLSARYAMPEDTVVAMQRWVQEIVVCNFDLDRGPVVEHRMAGRPWGKGEKENMWVFLAGSGFVFS